MSDRIDGVSGAGTPLAPSKPQSAPARVEQVTQPNTTREGSDLVSLTNSAEALTALHKGVGETTPIDRQKVDAIKQALAAGEYRMDPERIAEKFIEIEQAIGKL